MCRAGGVRVSGPFVYPSLRYFIVVSLSMACLQIPAAFSGLDDPHVCLVGVPSSFTNRDQV